MTSELKHFIELSDVIAVQVSCSCKATITRPIDKIGQLPQICGACQGNLVDDKGDAVSELASCIRRADAAISGKPYTLRLEIRPSTAEKSEPGQ